MWGWKRSLSQAPQPGETIKAAITLDTAGGALDKNAPKAADLVTITPSAVYFTADNYSSEAVVKVSRSAPLLQTHAHKGPRGAVGVRKKRESVRNVKR